MDEKVERLKDRANPAAGDLTDDRHLKREGEIDRAAAKIKVILGEIKTKIDDAVDALTSRPRSGE